MASLIYNTFFIFITGFLKKKKENRMGDYLIISKQLFLFDGFLANVTNPKIEEVIVIFTLLHL